MYQYSRCLGWITVPIGVGVEPSSGESLLQPMQNGLICPLSSLTCPATADCSVAIICKASLFGITGSSSPTPAELAPPKKGWYLGMTTTEQVVTSAITIFGVVTFSTHQPAVVPVAGSCSSNLGTARVYNISYTNAAGATGGTRFDDLSGDGLPPSPVAGQVRLDDGRIKPFCIGCSKDSPLEGSTPTPIGTVIQPTQRLYWYIQK